MDITMREAINETIDIMLINIYYGSEVAEEVMFASNCLEAILGMEFNEDQEIRLYKYLLKRVKKYFY